MSMNILFYLPEGNPVSEVIHGLVEIVAGMAETEIYRNIDDFAHRLCWPGNRQFILILTVQNRKDLDSLVDIQQLISGLPFILILPDRKQKTTAIGYSLGPRYLTYADENLKEVVAVLGKMLEIQKSRNVTEQWDNIWE